MNLENALDLFRRAGESLDTALVRAPGFRPLARTQAGAARADMLAFCPILIDAHNEAVLRGQIEAIQVGRLAISPPAEDLQVLKSTGNLDMASIVRRFGADPWSEEMRTRLNLMQASMLAGVPAVQRLQVCYKAVAYFVRVYQDAIYCVLLNLSGQRTASGSMTAALSDASPVGRQLRAEALGYLEWFRKWRDFRNAIKKGRDFGLLGPQQDPGVTFVVYREADNSVEIDVSATGVRLRDIAEAVAQSTAATWVALGAALKAEEVRAAGS